MQEEMQPADLSAVDRTQRVLDVKCQRKQSPFLLLDAEGPSNLQY